MKVFFSPTQKAHRPSQFLVAGRFRPNPDVPERTERFLAGISDRGHEIAEPEDFGMRYVSSVHAPSYIDFLSTAYSKWSALPNAAEEVVPNVHPRVAGKAYPRSIVGQAGYHLSDLACPINEHTWESSLWGAHSATAAALAVRDGGLGFAYAMCRPPGHHAGPDFAGGFCYINNAAVAAEILRKRYDRVAIVDVDVHHGNGTQEIFYRRPDVLTVSLHGDPGEFYPFFWGYADERGQDEGLGRNANFPLPRHTADEAYLNTLRTALTEIRSFRAEALVVSLGLDSFERDPLAFLKITTEGFARIAHAVSALRLPTVLVQEGGYMCDELGRNLASFLGGFEAERKS
jgi:acetoin utilization deacetylase AcuC-like enzyme